MRSRNLLKLAILDVTDDEFEALQHNISLTGFAAYDAAKVLAGNWAEWLFDPSTGGTTADELVKLTGDVDIVIALLQAWRRAVVLNAERLTARDAARDPRTDVTR